MSSSIIGRIDEMGNRIDDLERSITELMEQVSSIIHAELKSDVFEVTNFTLYLLFSSSPIHNLMHLFVIFIISYS